MGRSKQGQAAHDRKVRQEAKRLQQQGFDVNADIPGFQRPKTLSGFRPDIIARKGRQRKIVEVETQESKDTVRDKNQQRSFREAAKRNQNTTFRRFIAEE